MLFLFACVQNLTGTVVSPPPDDTSPTATETPPSNEDADATAPVDTGDTADTGDTGDTGNWNGRDSGDTGN
ncbi:MAG: hypothetical protein ACOZNI_20440 [Myxococcota bacterium]